MQPTLPQIIIMNKKQKIRQQENREAKKGLTREERLVFKLSHCAGCHSLPLFSTLHLTIKV
jgi:hypothetical protein